MPLKLRPELRASTRYSPRQWRGWREIRVACTRRRSARLLLALVLLFGLGACSATGFFYNRLDSLIPWYLGRYVSLTTEQRALLDAEVQTLLEWHRQHELPRYVLLLDAVQQRLDVPVTPAVIAELSEEAEQSWLRLRERAMPALLRLAETLDSEQIEAFLQALEERQQTLEQKYLPRTDAQYSDEAQQSLRRGLKRYLGRLSAEQEQLIARASQSLLRADAGWLGERQRAIAALGVPLKAREPGWQQDVQGILEHWWDEVPADYREIYLHNADQLRTAVAAVIAGRDARQDQRLRSRLSKLRDELAALMP